MLFGEDACGVTKAHGLEKLHTLRKPALAVLRAAPSSGRGKKKITGPKRQFIVTMNPDYLLAVLVEP